MEANCVEGKEEAFNNEISCLKELFPESGYRTGEVELPCGFAPSNRYLERDFDKHTGGKGGIKMENKAKGWHNDRCLVKRTPIRRLSFLILSLIMHDFLNPDEQDAQDKMDAPISTQSGQAIKITGRSRHTCFGA